MSSWLTTKPIAHRGLHNGSLLPENSYAAFQNAIDKNLPVELDLRFTQDEKIIVFHDDNLLRMTGNDKPVSNTAWNEIKNYRLTDTQEKIPLFAEFLEFINGKVPVLVEIKNFGKPGIFERELKQTLQNYKGEFAVQSFNPLSIKWFRKNAPGLTLGQIASKFREDNIPLHYKFLLKNLVFNPVTKPDFINYHIDDLPYLPVMFYRKVGISLLGWTIKKEEQLTKAKNICDNFVFENIPVDKIE